MGKVLVVRKPDRTVHVVPLNNKALLMGMNHRLPVSHKMKFEEMEEKEALALPFFDENYVSPALAQEKLKEVEGDLKEKDSKIAELEAQLAKLLAAQQPDKADDAKPATAPEIIEAIKAAKTIEEVKAYATEGETRTTVLNAITKRIAELEAK